MCGSILGSSKVSTPEVQKVNPVATQVTPDNVANQTSQAAENKKQKQRRGLASTQLDNQTLAGGATNGSGAKTSLG